MPPRTRNRPDRFNLSLAGQEVVITEERLTASRHLSNQFLSMCRELKREVSCPICYYVPEGEAVEKAMVVRVCGHTQCCQCLLTQMDHDDASCAVCRQ